MAYCSILILMLFSLSSGLMFRSSLGSKLLPRTSKLQFAQLSAQASPSAFGQYARSDRWDVIFKAKTDFGFAGEALIVPFYKPKEKEGIEAALKAAIPEGIDNELKSIIHQAIDEKVFNGDAQYVVRLSGSQPTKYLALIGLSKADSTEGSTTKIGSTIAKLVRDYRIRNIGAIVPTDISPNGVRDILLGVADASYSDSRFKKRNPATEKDNFPGGCSVNVDLLRCSSEIVSDFENLQERTAKLADGVHFAKDLVGAPPAEKNPLVIAEEARKIAQAHGLECTILGEVECNSLGMGGYLGVQQGSKFPPQFIHLKYTPEKSDIEPTRVALVGKGLTFDSGGYNLKVGAGSQIEMMKYDMGGCAAVLGSAVAIAQLKPKNVEVHWISAVCENMISENAVRPGDILKASNGKTIEVLNTDAEGRLTLSDALVYAEKQGVDVIIDLATLTGAIVVGVGEQYAGLYANDDKLRDQIEQAAARSNECIWRMPLVESYKSQIKSKIADLRNIGGGKGGGSITAALFLQEFVDKVKWAHIDMAGPVWDSTAHKPTGYGVKLLVDYLLNLKKD